MLSTRPQCSNRPTFPDSGALRLVYAVQMKAILLSFISFACSLICMELTVILYLLSRGPPSEPPRGPMRVSVDPPEPYWRLNHACPRLANPPRQSYLLQHGLENARFASRNRNGSRPHQGLGMVLGRILKHLSSGSVFHEPAVAHHRDVVAHAFDDRHVVRDEEIGDAHLLLQFEKQV